MGILFPRIIVLSGRNESANDRPHRPLPDLRDHLIRLMPVKLCDVDRPVKEEAHDLFRILVDEHADRRYARIETGSQHFCRFRIHLPFRFREHKTDKVRSKTVRKIDLLLRAKTADLDEGYFAERKSPELPELLTLVSRPHHGLPDEDRICAHALCHLRIPPAFHSALGNEYPILRNTGP